MQASSRSPEGPALDDILEGVAAAPGGAPAQPLGRCFAFERGHHSNDASNDTLSFKRCSAEGTERMSPAMAAHLMLGNLYTPTGAIIDHSQAF